MVWDLSTTNKPVVNPNLRAQVTSKTKFPHSLAAKVSLRGQNSQHTGHQTQTKESCQLAVQSNFKLCQNEGINWYLPS